MTNVNILQEMRQIPWPNMHHIFVDLIGNTYNFLTGGYISPNSKGDILLYDPIIQRVTNVETSHVVAEAWYSSPEEQWKNSPYADVIRRYQKFLFLPINFKKFTGLINSFGGKYWICRNGDLYEDRLRMRILPRETKQGYLKFPIVGDPRVHRLVAKAFCIIPHRLAKLGLTYKDLQVNHIDGNKKNNHCTNLEWCTGQENIDHAWKTGLMKTVLSDAPLNRIGDDLAAGMRDQDIARKYGMYSSVINNIRRRTYKRAQALPQQWKLNSQFCTGDQLEKLLKSFLNGELIKLKAKEIDISVSQAYCFLRRETFPEVTINYLEEMKKEYIRRGWYDKYGYRLTPEFKYVPPTPKAADPLTSWPPKEIEEKVREAVRKKRCVREIVRKYGIRLCDLEQIIQEERQVEKDRFHRHNSASGTTTA